MSANEFIDQETANQRKLEEQAKEAKKSARKKKKEENKGKKKGNGRLVIQIMNGEFLTKDWFIRNLPFTFFIAFLLVLLIGWGYYGETMTKKEIRLQEELGELNSEYYTLSSEYITKKGRQQIKEKLTGSGLVESRVSPKKIRVNKYTFD